MLAGQRCACLHADYATLFRFLPINGGCGTSDDDDSIYVVVLARIYFAIAVTRIFVRLLP